MTDINVSQPLSLLNAEQCNELESLLQPISEDYPTGPPIRFDPIFTELRLAREEDDPNLPMGVWERPLKRADWGRIEKLCKTTLSRHAKDLQIAAWLTEASTRRLGMEGLLHGLLLVHGLLERYWETVHLQIDEDGDADLRVAPLQWMNASLSSTIRTMMPLLGGPAGQLDKLCLADWERMVHDEAESAKHGNLRKAAQENGEPLRTRAAVVGRARANRDNGVDRSLRLVRGCLTVLQSIEHLTDARLGADAPSIAKLRDTLRGMERAWMEMTAAPEQDVAQQPDAVRIPETVSDDVVQPNHAPPANVAQLEKADSLGRRIDAICAAAGIHAPSGAERLMAMQVGLLQDQNAILQTLAKEQAGQIGAQPGTDAACGDFTALVRAVLAAAR